MLALSDGIAVGMTVGGTVGVGVVGVDVGTSVGWSVVGAAVSSASRGASVDGSSVGAIVGANVGESVSMRMGITGSRTRWITPFSAKMSGKTICEPELSPVINRSKGIVVLPLPLSIAVSDRFTVNSP